MNFETLTFSGLTYGIFIAKVVAVVATKFPEGLQGVSPADFAKLVTEESHYLPFNESGRGKVEYLRTLIKGDSRKPLLYNLFRWVYQSEGAHEAVEIIRNLC